MPTNSLASSAVSGVAVQRTTVSSGSAESSARETGLASGTHSTPASSRHASRAGSSGPPSR